MRKVCEVYLGSSTSDDERGVELTFPVGQYEMMDAFEQIRQTPLGDVYWQVDEFYCFDYLAPHLDENMSILLKPKTLFSLNSSRNASAAAIAAV